MNKKGLFIGKSHDDGGIPSMIKETGTPIEIEGEEYYICRESYNSTDVHSFKNKTNKEVLDSIYTKYSCTLVQEVMNAGDFIVCKVVVNDKSKRDRSGTVKEILNQMQSEKSCKVEDASSVARRGGGVSGELLAPNGKKSNLTPKQYKLVRTDAFKDWFGDWENDPENSSKVIDDNGEPKVVYHGSDKNGVGFTKFNTTIKSPRNVGEFQWEEFGAFFSDDYKTAEYYAFKGETRNIPSLSGEVRGFFLDIKNPLISFNNDKMWYDVIPEIFEKHERKQNGQLHKPLIVKRQFLYTSRNKRYDGFIVKGINEADVPNTTTYHIKKSSQAKLADGSNVKFNSKTNDIRFKQGGEMKKQKRYTADADFFVYAKSDREAEKEAREILSKIDKKYDNNPSLNHLTETPFGSTQSRKLFSGGGGVGSKPSFDDFSNTRDAIIALMRYYGIDFHKLPYHNYEIEHVKQVNLNWERFPKNKDTLAELMSIDYNLIYEFNTPVVSGTEPLFTINQYAGEIRIQPYNSVGLIKLFGKGAVDFDNDAEYMKFLDVEIDKLRDEAFNSPKTKTKKQTKVVKTTNYSQENIFSRNLSSLIDKSSNDELILERSKLVELLDYFEAPKDLVAIKEISNEINKINTKINDLLVSENSKIGSVDSTYLFTPSNLLNYYYTQTSQSPVNKKIVPCKLETPNGAKSKLPVDTYWQVRTEAFKKWFGDWELAYKTDNYNDCSLIIDKDTKEPRIMFHGVRKFHPKFQTANMGKGVKRPYGTFEPESFPASYFSDNLEYVKFYGGNAKDMPTPYSGYNGFYYNVFINMRNPILLDELGFKSSINDFTDYLLVRYGLSVKVSDKIINAARGDYDRPIKTWAYIREGAEMIEQFKANGYDGIVQLGDVPRFDNKGDSIIDSEYLSFYPNQIKSADVKNSHFLPIFDDIRFKDGGSIGEDENNNESLSEILKKY